MSQLSKEALLAARLRLLDEDDILMRKSSKRDKEEDGERKHKKKKKEKKAKKKKSKKKSHSSSESSGSSDESDAWVEAPIKKSKDIEKPQRPDTPEEQPVKSDAPKRDDWMTMTGMFATFTRDDIKPKRDNKKKNIDDYDPAKSVRELNPYWKDGGMGLPSENKSREPERDERPSQSSRMEYSRDSDRREQYSRDSDRRQDNYRGSNRNQDYSRDSNRNQDYSRNSNRREDHAKDRREDYSKDRRQDFPRDSDRRLPFKKPSYDDDRPSYGRDYRNDGYSGYKSSRKSWQRRRDDSPERKSRRDSPKRSESPERRSPKRKHSSSPEPDRSKPMSCHSDSQPSSSNQPSSSARENEETTLEKTPYLTDQQMNAIGAKIVKAEILGNTKLVAELTAKLNAAREYKKANPNAGKKDEGVMLTLTDEKGNVRPLTKSQQAGDPRSKGGKKKITTHAVTGERTRFFEDDDKYSLTQMFEKEKFGNSHESEKEFVDAISRHRNPNDDLEDIFAEKITKTKSDAKVDEQNKRKAISQHKTVSKSLENCDHCVDSDKMLKHLIVSLGTKAYVALPARKSLTEGHCYIATTGHVTCSTMADEDVWAEIMTYRRALTNLFNSRDEDVVFFETAVHFHKYPHLVINCVPLPRDVGDSAPIYFKKAIMECETEWSNNKKVVDLKGKDVRRGVPQRLPYFWVDFGMDPGFAHVIEDQNLFPANFAQEIVGGMLDLDHSLWRKPQRENFDAQRKKVLQFEEMWKTYDPKPT